MKIVLALLIGFLGMNLRCRERSYTLQEYWERADEAPRSREMPGTYEAIKDGTTLILEERKYTVSKNGEVLKEGTWDYQPPTTKGADYTVGPPGCGCISFDWPGSGENWYSFVCFDGKTIVLDTIRSYTGKLPAFFSKETYGYRKISE